MLVEAGVGRAASFQLGGEWLQLEGGKGEFRF